MLPHELLCEKRSSKNKCIRETWSIMFQSNRTKCV